MTVLAERPAAPPVGAAVEEPQPYSAEDFARFACAYPDLRMEMTKEGEIIIMPPAFSETGRRNGKLTTRLTVWAETDGRGETFDSSTGFTLPNGARRSPDASWVEKSRWEALSREQRENEFAPLCPDFVIELRSATDRLSKLQEKMREYVANGAQLGWLIDPPSRRVEVYRPGRDMEVVIAPETVSGDPELPGFVLALGPIWNT